MNDAAFVLDARLKNDTRHVVSLDLCDVLLMNDARFPWLVLVPRQLDRVEICDLSADDQALLWREVNRASQALRTTEPFDKLNLGALGNIVRQLHVHVVGRREGDAAWPGPVWGSGTAVPYGEETLASLLQALRRSLA
ncbi:HIT domain-containing protein [Dyella japonica]|uniref:Diadenosine tetraphosphate hydrolase n=1 Tax=Dyella japonica A8 TaxID=1217721 RepID=A0A075K4H5_9GAMM|nr:HIT family protein [Dyella japonica]AIF48582.1 diadenosine tetraphosphate hydrolase [Dyella japonica A8]